MANVFHVEKDPATGRWKVYAEGFASGPFDFFDTKELAFETAKRLADAQRAGRALLHRADGTIEREYKSSK